MYSNPYCIGNLIEVSREVSAETCCTKRSNPYCIGILIEEKLIFADAEKEALVLILIVLET